MLHPWSRIHNTGERLPALYQVTAPGGYLFIGHAETIAPDGAGYRSVRPAVYQRPEVL